MKNTILLASMLVVAILSHAQPRAHWLRTDYDFGAFAEERGPVTARIGCVNIGDEPLVITGARATCGCTTPRFDRAPVAPGDTAWVTVSYDPQGRPGRFSKKVYIDTNTDPGRATLTVKGVVVGSGATLASRFPVAVGPLRLPHATVLLGTLDKGHVKSVAVTAYNQSTDTIRPAVVSDSPWVEVRSTPPAVGPGEQTALSFFVRSDRTPLYGVVTDTLTLYPDGFDSQPVPLPVVATLNEDFSRLTADDYARAPQAQISEVGADGSFTIANAGKQPLVIRRVYTMQPGIDITVDRTTVKRGKSARVKIAKAPGSVPVKITVITNDPITPHHSLTVN